MATRQGIRARATAWWERRSLDMTGTTPIDTIIQGDCLEEMKKLPANSIKTF